MSISPLNASQRQRVVAATHDCLVQAGGLFGRVFPPIPVQFDLRGRAAGMYRVRQGSRLIRYNPHIFAKYFDEGLAQTVPHEVAHYVTDLLHGLRRVRPHGPEWRAVAQALGARPRATAHYDLTDIPVRRQATYTYRCACMRHGLSAQRHNRVRRGQAQYLCRRCQSPLVYDA
ncbi:MAG: SprT-like domain-containing protein [Gammaproteobacteria bacterium]